MRILASIFALFYFLNVVGYGLEVHYCLGQVSDVNHALLDTFCPCDSYHADEPPGCCEEKSFFVQLEDEHAPVTSLEDLKMNTELLTVFEFGLSSDGYQIVEFDTSITDRAPPPERDRVIEFQSLQFYG